MRAKIIFISEIKKFAKNKSIYPQAVSNQIKGLNVFHITGMYYLHVWYLNIGPGSDDEHSRSKCAKWK